MRDWESQGEQYTKCPLQLAKVLDEGNCGRATDRGEEACEGVRKRQVCLSPPGHLLVKAARLRTETPYKAGVVRRAGPSRAKPFQLTAQVNGELVQRSITFLSGEICTVWSRPGVAPESRACPKIWNAVRQLIAAVQKSAEAIVRSLLASGRA